MNSDLIVSWIRTAVPVAVGAAATWLAAHFGVVIDDNSKAAVSLAVGSVVIAVYYAVVRFAESKIPAVGWLLGVAKQPGYVAGPAPAPAADEDVVAVAVPATPDPGLPERKPVKKTTAKKAAK